MNNYFYFRLKYVTYDLNGGSMLYIQRNHPYPVSPDRRLLHKTFLLKLYRYVRRK